MFPTPRPGFMMPIGFVMPQPKRERCNVSGCDENHSVHHCSFCDRFNVNHLYKDCPLAQSISSQNIASPSMPSASAVVSMPNASTVVSTPSSQNVHYHTHVHMHLQNTSTPQRTVFSLAKFK